ncbi:GTPase Der [Anaplasma platys]|uniref:GTPase Der n=1 Tax=Anaplasma platys TaxID=949 RepID=A0A858PXY5_9RICK|nr:ribosome biogenesis GTPase Der [Anaplasma platys]QJC27434.1 GTPase Der [Anaplasma platys]
MQKVAIVGLPNVGKSTLFNRLTKSKSAIVSNIAHVTRDRKEAPANFCGLKFTVIDTGGVAEGTGIQSLVTKQVQLAVAQSDVIFFVIDIKTSTTDNNIALGKWLRKATEKPIVLLVNKCESSKNDFPVDTMEYLEFIGPVHISAEHNLGMQYLYDAIAPFLEQTPVQKSRDNSIPISIMGQPNVGKSTFLNCVLGEDRVITDDAAGTTRDSISTEYNHKGIKLLITDTAGLRKRTKVTEDMEKLSTKSAIHALSKSCVVILMVDFLQGITQQDLSIAGTAIRDGKSVVVALNKADLISDKATEEEILKAICLHSRVDFDVPIMKISALKNIGCDKVLDKAIRLYESSSTHISTPRLNKWLRTAVEHHPPHVQNCRKVKLKYISQVSVLPPTFVVATNTPGHEIESSYKSYLKNSFLTHFSLQGVPIRMIFRKGENPYTKAKN